MYLMSKYEQNYFKYATSGVLTHTHVLYIILNEPSKCVWEVRIGAQFTHSAAVMRVAAIAHVFEKKSRQLEVMFTNTFIGKSHRVVSHRVYCL